ncbi:MAG: multidrug effflux MFS transporter [Alphaproteobacteria bacterium]|jgi:MFS transporter, DHA1 family, multidrug resistance protein|nr:multidrug effflux MFS transporter [Alphaproteobacteria bacterium]MBT4017362.1 multidrug effflux MFS transporter [Alphaproteobacteria bacterium]MBT4965875.1 multidrug effflux MFS transporter [Alphaproteobacteria bacterium]MBT5158786.1 multidrug effflux MFS transporter [Alphaproteobacteria bacterium]MBT6387364.1 multidrug effflux MFS transporter [Alphaproteobacteria bacterium]
MTDSQRLIQRPGLFVLICITMIGQLAMNITLPSLPGIVEDFGTTEPIAQLNLSLYLVGTAVAQLIYGPLSDRFGRRPLVLIGLIIFVLGSVMCLLASNIETLIIGRVIQSVGGCAGIVMGRAMVRDIFSTDKAAAMIANLTSAVVIVPGLAPLIGGYFDVWYGWRLSIAFVLVLGVLIFFYALRGAHETLAVEKRHESHFFELLAAFGVLLRNRIFTAYALQVSFNTGAYFSFLGGSSIVFRLMEWGTPAELGFYFFGITVFYIGGNVITSRFAHRVGAGKINLAGTVVAMSGMIMLLLTHLAFGLEAPVFFGFVCFLAFGNGMCISTGVALAIGADSRRVGAAAGLSGSLQLGFSAIATWAVSLLLTESPFPLVLAMLALCFGGLVTSVAGTLLTKRTSS